MFRKSDKTKPKNEINSGDGKGEFGQYHANNKPIKGIVNVKGHQPH